METGRRASLALVTNDAKLEHIATSIATEREAEVWFSRSPEETGKLLRHHSELIRVIDMAATSPLAPRDREALSLWAGGEGEVLGLAARDGLARSGQVLAYDRAEFAARGDEILGALLPVCSNRDPVRLILGQSEGVRRMCEQVRCVAQFREVSVLVLGETGTGKEVVARALHEMSAAPQAPFVAVNCAAIPSSLFESELFGHEAGSFTGAKGSRPGLFEAAADGTLFLKGVGDLPADLQPKLLRALETRQFRCVGGNKTIPLTARIISATNRGLNGVRDSTLRLDLHFRLAGFTIELPPLRERGGDVELLARSFLEGFVRRNNTVPMRLADAALDMLAAHDWPGNVRELKVVVERSAILARGGEVEVAHVADSLGRAAPRMIDSIPANDTTLTTGALTDSAGISGLRRIEKDLVLAVFEDSQKNLSLASRVLGVPRSTLRDKLRRYGAM
mgnify:CR=1 FL=1